MLNNMLAFPGRIPNSCLKRVKYCSCDGSENISKLSDGMDKFDYTSWSQ